MATCQLRVFPHVNDDLSEINRQDATVSVRLGELYPVLEQALKINYGWIRDFEDDEIRVTPDFYDVVRAFLRVRPPA